MNSKGDPPDMHYVAVLSESVQRLPALPPARAAKLLRVNPRTIYRYLRDGRLEQVPCGSRAYVSLRSIARYLEDQYGPTTAFNLLEEIYQS